MKSVSKPADFDQFVVSLDELFMELHDLVFWQEVDADPEEDDPASPAADMIEITRNFLRIRYRSDDDQHPEIGIWNPEALLPAVQLAILAIQKRIRDRDDYLDSRRRK